MLFFALLGLGLVQWFLGTVLGNSQGGLAAILRCAGGSICLLNKLRKIEQIREHMLIFFSIYCYLLCCFFKKIIFYVFFEIFVSGSLGLLSGWSCSNLKACWRFFGCFLMPVGISGHSRGALEGILGQFQDLSRVLLEISLRLLG